MPELIDIQRHRTAKILRKMHTQLTEKVKRMPRDEGIRRRLADIERQIQSYEADVRRQV